LRWVISTRMSATMAKKSRSRSTFQPSQGARSCAIGRSA
jgi:hypothetical protein